MSHLPKGSIPLPDSFGQSLTLFYSEGSKVAVSVKNTNGLRRERALKMPTAEAALAWAKAKRAFMVYLPLPASAN